MENKYCVYKHTTPSEKIYIGVTCKKPNRRWNNGKGYSNNRHFNNAIEKYGWDNIKHEIVFQKLSKEEASEKEKELIALYNSNDPKFGYNHTSGGYEGYHLNKEQLEALSKRVKKQFDNKEFKKKFDESMKRPERRKRISESLKIYYESEEAKIKSSKSQKAKWDDELREKVSKLARERGKRPEYRKKLSEATKKRWENDDYRKSMSGKNNPIARPINQMSIDGIFIKTFETIQEAEIFVGVKNAHCNIVACAKGRQKTAYGYKWEYTV